MTLPRLVLFVLLMSVFGASFSALADDNVIRPASASVIVRPIGPNDLKPSACAHIDIAVMIAGNGTLDAPDTNTLLIGGPGADTLNGGRGYDCLVGGWGDNSLNGGQGHDVLIGGPGNERIFGGPGNDICYGRGGKDQFINCQQISND